MEAYRLYTVVPRLVHMIEELTNWYVRMNKERFAGERGDAERADALSTLFEVLLMLSRMMSPLTPFFTELMYQNLRRVIADAPASVHYLMMPEVNQVSYP
jgi:isoleucyl-tRNA synthetase